MKPSLFNFHFSLFLLLFPASAFAQTDSFAGSYLLSVGDQVIVDVHDQRDLGTKQEIDEDGNIRMKYIGVVKLLGLSVRAAEKAIEAQYTDQRYLRSPDASVQIAAYSSKPVIVRGAVYKPGLIELDRYPNGLDIYRVIAMAGGFRDIAKEGSIRVIREGSDGKAKIFEVDVSAKGKKKSPAIFDRFIVLPHDIIEIDETTF